MFYLRFWLKKSFLRLLKGQDRVAVAALFYCIALVFFALIGDQGLWRSYRLWTNYRTIEVKNEQLRQDIVKIGHEIKGFENNLRHIERYAREELNLAGPDEMIFVFK